MERNGEEVVGVGGVGAGNRRRMPPMVVVRLGQQQQDGSAADVDGGDGEVGGHRKKVLMMGFG